MLCWTSKTRLDQADDLIKLARIHVWGAASGYSPHLTCFFVPELKCLLLTMNRRTVDQISAETITLWWRAIVIYLFHVPLKNKPYKNQISQCHAPFFLRHHTLHSPRVSGAFPQWIQPKGYPNLIYVLRQTRYIRRTDGSLSSCIRSFASLRIFDTRLKGWNLPWSAPLVTICMESSDLTTSGQSWRGSDV